MSSEEKKSIYLFNIMVEAKMRALAIMTKKHHPDWSIEEIKDHLERLVGYCIKKEIFEE